MLVIDKYQWWSRSSFLLLHLPYSRSCVRYFTCILSFYSPNKPWSKCYYLYSRGTRGLEMLVTCPHLPKQECGGSCFYFAELFWIQIHMMQSHCSFHCKAILSLDHHVWKSTQTMKRNKTTSQYSLTVTWLLDKKNVYWR